MIDIIVCIIMGIVGLVICEIIENIMWEHDRDKALDIDFSFMQKGGKK